VPTASGLVSGDRLGDVLAVVATSERPAIGSVYRRPYGERVTGVVGQVAQHSPHGVCVHIARAQKPASENGHGIVHAGRGDYLSHAQGAHGIGVGGGLIYSHVHAPSPLSHASNSSSVKAVMVGGVERTS